jgi:hypothetical protein
VAAALVAALLLGSSVEVARRHAAQTFTPELAAARRLGPWLRGRLAPGEAVMAATTSYWAWFADRPAVFPPVAEAARFDDVARRLRVRYAALPTAGLDTLAARYPAGRLPESLEPLAGPAVPGVALFRVRPPGEPPGP